MKEGTNPKKEYASRSNFLKVGFNDPNPGPGTYADQNKDWTIGNEQMYLSTRKNKP